MGQGECQDITIGTSYAAPVVSGVVALMLEANANLTWRDVQVSASGSILAPHSFRLLPAPSGSFRLLPAYSGSFRLLPAPSGSFRLLPAPSGSF